jgi:hypothetical protein
MRDRGRIPLAVGSMETRHAGGTIGHMNPTQSGNDEISARPLGTSWGGPAVRARRALPALASARGRIAFTACA